MEAARRYAVGRVIVCSTTEIYGQTGGTVVEATLPAPQTVYAASKVGAEQSMLGYVHEHGVDAVALRLSVVVAVLLGGLPLLFAAAPDLAEVEVIGMRLPWLLLGVLAYPFLFAVAWVHVRQAERNEQDLTDFVDSS